MKTRTTLVLLLVAVALGCYIKFYESKRPNTEEATRRGQNIVNFERDKIDGVNIQNGDERVELKRVDKKWRLVAPVNDLADNTVVDSLLFDLESWQKEATISAKEIEADRNKMAEYGLAKAKLRLKLIGTGAPPEIWFGNNAALENRVYVRLENAKDVFLAPKNIRDEIARKTEDFRDRKLTDTVAAQITRLDLKTPAGEMELEKQADHWQIVKPLRARADDEKVNDLLAQITNSRIQQFVTEDKSDLHQYGLSEPRGVVTFFTGEIKPAGRPDSAHGEGQLLQIGAVPEKQKDEVYVRFAPRHFVYTLPAKIEAILNTKPNDLRDRHLVRFDQNQLDRITIEALGGAKTVLARKGEDWTIASRQNAPANSAEVRRLLELLASQQVTAFAADVASDLSRFGLDQPQLKIALSSFASENTAETTAGEHPLAAIAFGKTEGENIYARVGDDPFVVTVPRALLENIPSHETQWQELSIFKAKPEDVHRLEVIADRTENLTRGADGKWLSNSGPVNANNVQSLLNTLVRLRAVRWLGPSPATASAKPQLVVTFTTSPDDKAVHKLTIEGPTENGMWRAHTEERPGTFVLSNPDVNALRLSLVGPAAAAATATPAPSGSPPVSPTP